MPVLNELTDRVYLAANDGQIICLRHRDLPQPIHYRAPEVPREEEEGAEEEGRAEGRQGRRQEERPPTPAVARRVPGGGTGAGCVAASSRRSPAHRAMMAAWRGGIALAVGLLVAVPVCMPFARLIDPEVWQLDGDELYRIGRLSANTLFLVAGTCVLAVPSGTLLAVLLFRTGLPGRHLDRPAGHASVRAGAGNHFELAGAAWRRADCCRCRSGSAASIGRGRLDGDRRSGSTRSPRCRGSPASSASACAGSSRSWKRKPFFSSHRGKSLFG